MRFVVLLTLLSGIALAQGPSLEGTRWTLASYAQGQRFVQVSPALGATLEFAQGRAGGSTGCNSFGGAYTLDGPKLSFGPLAQTMRACADPLGPLERAYNQSLAQVRSFEVAAGVLRLKNQAGETVLILAQARPQAIQGREWRVTALNTGSAVVSVPQGAKLTASFAGGRLGGNTGCNQFSAPYTLNGFGLKVGPVVSTKRACLDEGASQQEAALLRALAGVASFRVVGNDLTLYDRDGKPLVNLSR